MKRCVRFLLIVSSIGAALVSPGRTQKPADPLSVEEVIEMSKAGVSEEVIVTKIKKNGKAFDLSPSEIVTLKNTGISDSIVNFLLDPTLPYAPPPKPVPPPSARPDVPPPTPAPPSPPAKRYPADPHAAKVPPEPGLYRFPGDVPVKIDIKLLLGTQEGAGLGKVLMKKGKLIAYLVGQASKNRIKESNPVFYMRLPEGKAIEEVVLIACERKSDRREIEMGPPGPKPQLKAEAMRQFDSLEVGPAVFKLTATKLTGGEYLFFQLGSAEPPKGSYGKGFDFGVDQPKK